MLFVAIFFGSSVIFWPTELESEKIKLEHKI